MSGQLGMCISFFIQTVLRSFLHSFILYPPFHLPLPNNIIFYHIMGLFLKENSQCSCVILKGKLTVFLREKHITVFLLLNVTGPTFALCSRLGGNERSIFCQVL